MATIATASNSATSHRATLIKCNIKTVQHLLVQYYNIKILNSATVTIATTTSTTDTGAIIQY